MQGKKAHSKHTWNTPARLYYNFPASILILDVCIQNQQAKQEDWPQLFSYNVQEKRDLLALLVAVKREKPAVLHYYICKVYKT